MNEQIKAQDPWYKHEINNEIIETVEETKLLGTILTSDLKWDRNTNNIVKKSYARLELLRKLAGFNAPKN